MLSTILYKYAWTHHCLHTTRWDWSSWSDRIQTTTTMKTLVIVIVTSLVICEMNAQSNMRQLLFGGYKSLLMRRTCKLCKDQSRFAWLCPTLINKCGKSFFKLMCPLSCKLCKPCAELDAAESGGTRNQGTGAATGPENDGTAAQVGGEARSATLVLGANPVSVQTTGVPGAQASCSPSE